MRMEGVDIEGLFRQYYRPLCLYAARYVDDSDDVEDIVQSSFHSFLEYYVDEAIATSSKAYLYKIVHNRCIDFLRSNSSKRLDLVDALPDLPDDEIIDRTILWADLWNAIDRLPRKRRQVLLLSKRDGLSHAEIAKLLNISERTVHNQLSKALDTLKKEKNRIFFNFFNL